MYKFKKENFETSIYKIEGSARNSISQILNPENPHILGLDANEIFFLNDNVILVEGQEDVICYKKIFEKYNYYPTASFFGWGIGGAKKILLFLDLLDKLGYKKIFVLLDNNVKMDILEKINDKYKNVEFDFILTDDIRSKKDSVIKNTKKI